MGYNLSATSDSDLLVWEEIYERVNGGPGDDANEKQSGEKGEADSILLLSLKVDLQGLGERVDFADDRIKTCHFIITIFCAKNTISN
jgi:hypothetical protein